MRIGSLCTGYGGLDHATANHYNATVAWHAENAAAPSRVLAYHHPDTPNLGDFTSLDWTSVEPVDIITAGYPCQPFSTAGHRRGTNDHRHLWPAVARAISILRPRHVVLENVAAHLSLGFDSVLADLAGLGYDARWGVVRASDAGAPHQRARLFVVATDTADRPGEPQRARTEPRRRSAPPTNTDGKGRKERGHHPGRRRDAEPTHGPASPPADAAGVGRERSGDTRLGRTGPPHRDPTPADAAGQRRRRRPHVERPDGPQAERSEEVHPARGRDTAWGDYEPAIRRWETITGRPAPNPTTPGRNNRPRLNPQLSEWLMGLPPGHITNPQIGLTHAQQLRTIGNGVVPQQAALALQHLDPQ